MTKIYKFCTVNIEDWDLNRVVDYVKSKGLQFKDVTFTKLEQSDMYDYGSPSYFPALEYRELETDDEYNKRIEDIQDSIKASEEREKREYQRLKEKYEHNN